MNKLLEEYINDNNLQIFEKEYLNDLTVSLSDGKSTMTLMQCFNYVMVEINGEFFNSFAKRKGLDGQSNWFVVKA